MRVAALFLGLIAGLFALLAPSALRTDLLSPFLEVWSATSNERLVGIIVWYAIPAAALLGGLLATVTPGFAALLLLGAAAGWLAVGLSMPQHFNFLLIAPAAAAALAAIFAFLAGELKLRRRRMARRNRKEAAEALVEDGETEREAALQMDPLVMPRDEPPPPPLRRPMPLTLDDVSVTSRPSSTAPGWRHNEPPGPQRGADDWVEARRSAPPTQLPGEPPAGPEARAGAAEQARPTPRLVEVDIRPEAVLRPATPVAREPRPRRTTGLVAAMAAVSAVLAFGILLAGGYLLYRDGTLTNLFGPPGQAPAIAAGQAPTVTAATLPADPPALPKLVAPEEVTVATPVAAAPAPVAAGTQPETYADPFSYCRAVKTIDHVDSRYSGPAFTEAMTKALLIPTGSARDRVRWRCFEGAVLACTSYAGPVCDMAPTVIEMREFCERNPNVERLMAPSGSWSCADGRPQLPADASWPVDERGFLPDSWVVVLNIGGTPAG